MTSRPAVLTFAPMSLHEQFMRRAIELAEANVRAGRGGPFGAVVVRDGEAIGEGVNEVTSRNDPTAHAEVAAIRAACRRLENFDLSGCVIYANCEPCPMCLAAIYWARLDRIFYANTRVDAARIGFDDAAFYEELTHPPASRRVPAERIPMPHALTAFERWSVKPDKIPY